LSQASVEVIEKSYNLVMFAWQTNICHMINLDKLDDPIEVSVHTYEVLDYSVKKTALVPEMACVSISPTESLASGGVGRKNVFIINQNFELKMLPASLINQRQAHCMLKVNDFIFVLGGKQGQRLINNNEYLYLGDKNKDILYNQWQPRMPMLSYR